MVASAGTSPLAGCVDILLFLFRMLTFLFLKAFKNAQQQQEWATV